MHRVGPLRGGANSGGYKHGFGDCRSIADSIASEDEHRPRREDVGDAKEDCHT
jgi:hypothetical protein